MAAKAATKAEVGLVIESPSERSITVPIVGITPLLCSRMTEETIQSILNPDPNNKKGKDYGDPEQRWRDAAYTFPDGRYGFPGDAFYAGLIRAGGRFTKTPMTEWRGRFHIPFGLVELKAAEPQMHFAMCRQKGVPMPAYRAEFVEWEMSVPVSFDERLISLEQLLTLMERMGYSLGIGAWRPEKNGPYGRFRVKRGGAN